MFDWENAIALHAHTHTHELSGGSGSKESACNARDTGWTPGWGRLPGEGNGYPLLYSFLENPHGQGSLVSYCPWGGKEFEEIERLTQSNKMCPLLVRGRGLIDEQLSSEYPITGALQWHG